MSKGKRGAETIDLTGQRFGMLTVIERDKEAEKIKYTGKCGVVWKCRCDCGNIVTRTASNLRRKEYPAYSCGCHSKYRGKAEVNIYNRNRRGIIHYTVAYHVESGTRYIFGTTIRERAKVVQKIASDKVKAGVFEEWYSEISKSIGEERWKKIVAKNAGGITA